MIQKIIKKLAKELKTEFPNIKEENFQFPGKFGDISCNICFIEAKKKGINPSKLALDKFKKVLNILPVDFVNFVSVDGGYINFKFNYPELSKLIFKEEFKKSGKKEKIMVEFSNPNPCKAMHIGNSRSTFIGDSLSRILKYCGNDVIKANYYNDLGKQVAKTVLAVDKYGLKKNKKIDHELAEIYAKLHAEGSKEELDNTSQKILYELENKTGKFRNEWKEVVKMATEGFEETYKNSKIEFDVYFYESDFKEEGKKLSQKLLKQGYAFENEGAIVINLEKEDPTIPNTILIRSDKTGVYLTSDISLTIHKFKKFKLDKSIWVVGADQNNHFRQLFKILKLLGCKWTKNCEHVNYGLITLKGSKMSSRSGEFILIDDLIEEINEKARKEVRKRNPDLDEEQILKITKKIGLGALKYDILKIERNKNVDFNPDKAIQFEGNTGPYIQYMAVRCNSILKNVKTNVRRVKKDEKITQVNEYEKELMKKFLEFEEVLNRTARQLKPNLLCNYAFELATAFSKFYENCKVIGSYEENFRLKLVKKTKKILEICLNLLGIEVPEKM